MGSVMKEANSPEEMQRAVAEIMKMRPDTKVKSKTNKMLEVDHYLDELEMAAIEAGECDSKGCRLMEAANLNSTENQIKARRKNSKTISTFHLVTERK